MIKRVRRDHYDWLENGQGRQAKSILIVSPYVEASFFTEVVKRLNVKQLIIVIDDGCRRADVEMLQKLSESGAKITVALASAPGLAHLKVFHTEWVTAKGLKHTFIYGSGNATDQAFAGDVNAELMCKADINARDHPNILAWLTDVRKAADDPENGKCIDPVRDAEVAAGVRIRLPAIKVKNAASKADSFDLWLQRGYLMPEYRPDAGFLRVPIPLSKNLPQGKLARQAREAGFEIPQTKRLNFPYIPPHDSQKGAGNWRSHFFVATDLGYWCSDACWQEKRNRFRKRGHPERVKSLEWLRSLGEDKERKKEICRAFQERIAGLWERFGPLADSYLKSSNGRVHRRYYQREFDRRLKRDLLLAADANFSDRYIRGFDLVPVPRFRLDTAAWKTFRFSFVEQIHLDLLKARPQSSVCRRIKSAFGNEDATTLELCDILERLEADWNKSVKCDDSSKTLGHYIDRYQDGKMTMADDDAE